MSIIGWKCADCGTPSPRKAVECDACGGTIGPYNTKTGARVSESEVESLIAEEERRIRAEKEKERKEEEEKEEKERGRKMVMREIEEDLARFERRMKESRRKKLHPTTSSSTVVPPPAPPTSPPLPPPAPTSHDSWLKRLTPEVIPPAVFFLALLIILIYGMTNGLKGTQPLVAPMTAPELAQRMISVAMGPRYEGEFEEIRDKLLALKVKPSGGKPVDPKKVKSGAKQNQLGLKAMKKRDYSKAWGHFFTAIQDDPKNERYLCNLGMVWEKRGVPAKAEEYYLLAVVNAPNSIETWRDFGRMRARMGNHDGAVGCFMVMGRISKKEETFAALTHRKDLTDKERNAIDAAFRELVRKGVI